MKTVRRVFVLGSSVRTNQRCRRIDEHTCYAFVSVHNGDFRRVHFKAHMADFHGPCTLVYAPEFPTPPGVRKIIDTPHADMFLETEAPVTLIDVLTGEVKEI